MTLAPGRATTRAMRRLAPLALLALTACPPKAEPPPPPEPPPPTPAPRDAGSAPVTRGPPWSLDRSAFTPPNIPDALTFYGWSADGQRYALQIGVPAEGADCSDAFRIHVVDASRDRFVGGEVDVKRDQPEGGANGCVPPDLAAVADARRAPLLDANGVVVGHFLPPTKLTKAGDGWRITWSNGATSRVEFEVKHETDDPYGPEAEKGAAYRLVIDGQTIEPGTRRRSGVIRYALDEARVFESPDGRHAAIVLERYERAFEGARRSWMSNGFARPTGAAP